MTWVDELLVSIDPSAIVLVAAERDAKEARL